MVGRHFQLSAKCGRFAAASGRAQPGQAAPALHDPGRPLGAAFESHRGRGRQGTHDDERIEALTDELAAPAYDVLTADELDELIAGLEPIATAAQAVAD